LTIANATKWDAAGLDAIHVAYRGSGGYMAGFANLVAANTNTGSGMRHLLAAETAPFAIKEPVVKNIPADDGNFDSFTFASSDVNQGVLELGNNDGTFDLAADGTTAKTVGVYTFYPRGGSIANPGSFMFLLTRQAHGQDSSTLGSNGFENELVFNTRVKPLGDEDRAYQKENKIRQLITFNETNILPFGTTSATDFGTYSRQSFIFTSDKRAMFHIWVADGSAAVTTALDYTPDTATTTKAWNFSAGTALTVSSINTTTRLVTLSAVPVINSIILVLYQTASFS
jgi:hypothetical protein